MSFAGIRVYENCTVKRILVQNDRVVAVETDKGTITCDYFVNCAGLVTYSWLSALELLSGSGPIS